MGRLSILIFFKRNIQKTVFLEAQVSFLSYDTYEILNNYFFDE